MFRLSIFARRLLGSLQRRRRDSEMADEIRAHLDGLTDRNIAAGMAPDDARSAALRTFGGVEQLKEQARDEGSLSWLKDSGRDVSYGARQLRKAPAFSIVAILTLAIGIGATTAIFSIVNSVIFRPLDYPDSEQLVVIQETYPPGNDVGPVTWGAYYYWLNRCTAFTDIAAWRYSWGNLTGAGDPQRVTTTEVTPNYFRTLGVQPVIGRVFRPDEASPGHDNVMLITHWYWLKTFGGKADVVNQALRYKDRDFTVVGVLPPNEQLDSGAPIFIPLVTSVTERESLTLTRESANVVARLKPGVRLAEAQSELQGAAEAMSQQYPATNKGRGVSLSPLLDDIIATTGGYAMTGVRTLLYLLLGAVAILLLIACVNLANLLLARATTRRKEIAMRAALGASRGRIVRQLLCESFLLAGLGGILGAVLAYWGLIIVKPLMKNLPRADQISLDAHALIFSLLLVLFTGVAFGLLPALQSLPRDLLEGIKDGGKSSAGRRSHRIRSTLIVAEMALALILLTGAGLLIHSFVRLQQVDLGFRTDGVFANRLELPSSNYSSGPQQNAFVDRLLERISSLPNISSAAFTSGMPIFGSLGAGFRIAGQIEEPNTNPAVASYAAITPEYFKTVGIPLLRGRRFSSRDVADAPRVVMISAGLAEKYFPQQDAIGQRICLKNSTEIWREIVGVVGEVKQWGPASDTVRSAPGHIYEPFAQNPTLGNLLLVVHTRSSVADVASALRSSVRALDPNLPLTQMFRLTEGVKESIGRFRLSMAIFSGFAVVAVLLAAIGIYGVMAYTVSQRRHEIGVRRALGAQRADIFKLVFSHAGKRVGLGLLIGLAGAFACSHLLRSLLFEISAHDPTTLVVVVSLLTAVAFLACLLPARRATQSDPMVALRNE